MSSFSAPMFSSSTFLISFNLKELARELVASSSPACLCFVLYYQLFISFILPKSLSTFTGSLALVNRHAHVSPFPKTPAQGFTLVTSITSLSDFFKGYHHCQPFPVSTVHSHTPLISTVVPACLWSAYSVPGTWLVVGCSW